MGSRACAPNFVALGGQAVLCPQACGARTGVVHTDEPDGRVTLLPIAAGVKVERSSAVKDELIITGNDIELVSKSAALINYQVSHVQGWNIDIPSLGESGPILVHCLLMSAARFLLAAACCMRVGHEWS